MKQHRVIHKHKLRHSHERVVLPCSDVKALSVGVSQGCPCLWYDRPQEPMSLFTAENANALPEEISLTNVEILCVFTGEEYCLETAGWRFLGTVVHSPTSYEDIVIHVYVKGF